MINKWFSSPRRPSRAPSQSEQDPAPGRREDIVSLELYEAAVRGERFAINQLGLAVLPLIRSAVQSILRGSATSNGLILEDLVQDVFVMLLDNGRCALSKWDPKRGRTLRGFLYVFARLRAIDRLRAHAHAFPRTDLLTAEDLAGYASGEPSLCEQTQLKEFLSELQARLPQYLKEEQLQLLALTIEDVPGEEIAQRLGKTTANIFQMRKRLRDTLLMLRDQIFSDSRPRSAQSGRRQTQGRPD